MHTLDTFMEDLPENPRRPPLQIASKMDPADKSTIESAVDDAISWLDTNQLAEVRTCSRGFLMSAHALLTIATNCTAKLL